MTMKKIRSIVLAGLIVAGCTIAPKTQNVKFSGALRTMMSGNLEATISLDSLSRKSHLYALGAFENLKGEIQIFDGEAFNTSVESNEVTFDRSFDEKAALLVYAEVTSWQSKAIPTEINTLNELEEFIEKRAKQSGLSMEKPFPFLITGKVDSLQWHVIDWVEGDTLHTHQKHQESGLNGTLKDRDIEIIGFFSKSHKAVFTHHTRFVHMHFKDKDEEIAGHVDELRLGSNMELKLPKI